MERAQGMERLKLLGAALLIWGCGAGAAASAETAGASPWVKGFHNESRLIAGTVTPEGKGAQTFAGIHILLDKGWKTYWRTPGDAGIPPNFDWSGSKNLKRAEVLWPAPIRLADPAGSSIGYKGEVVLPVVLEPETAGEPIEVSLRLEFAICEKICVPAEAKMALAVVPSGAAAKGHGAVIADFLGRVPHKVEPGDEALPRLREVRAEMSGAEPHLAIVAEFPAAAQDTDVFVEGPEELYIPMAKRVGKTPEGHERFRVDLADLSDSGALKGKPLRFTLVSSEAQTETRMAPD